MGRRWTWKVEADGLPVRKVTYDVSKGFPKVGGHKGRPPHAILQAHFESTEVARDYIDEMRKFDPHCGLKESIVTLSSGITPQYLSSFLQGFNMIDDACFNELQAEMKLWKQENRNDDDNNKGRPNAR